MFFNRFYEIRRDSGINPESHQPAETPQQIGGETMELGAVVAEYNPFHNGHLYQLQEIRRRGATHIVAVMSGNVVQRAEVACFYKRTRAKAAVLSGADLVIELPALYACAPAERFAEGAVRTLAGLGIPGTLWFGSECGNLEQLKRCVAALRQVDGSPELKEYLKKGYSFANARGKALEAICGAESAAVLRQPNNLLAVEYLRALERTNAPLTPATIRRAGADHDSLIPKERIASATLLRQTAQLSGIRQISPYVPPEAYALYRRDYALGQGGASMYALERVLLYHLKALSVEQLAALPEVQEGIEYRIYDAVRQASGLDDLLMRIKSKRYALSRIKRILMYAMLGITREDAALEPGYIRVLAFNQRGQEILRAARKSCNLPIYHSFARLERDFPIHAAKEALASDLFCAGLQKSGASFSEYRDPRPAFVPFAEEEH